ncbi:MAG: esterase-like activity of phytase family protein [Candidatus Devosia phytovorans]|uniref:Esterase-like activity of phytase family protein n=1 Tax=Candidatus Devosia phytovorans TaxID=3121372 RepID=A0AAJ5VWN5_9HYPH|nr:esterase-like activity of phytase family protein [Devosia sp.]WEK05461.1 MAG: esterase-like activity of phytase family protein [Devosia sp.]
MNSPKLLTALTAALLATTVSVNAAEYFNRVSSFPVGQNNEEAEASSSEIITATDDGMTLIYSDSPAGGVGFVDISDVSAPKAGGFIQLEGEPTSVTVIGEKAYVAADTSESFAEPSGKLYVIDIASQAIDGEFELGGQPDSIAHNKDNTILAIAIENQRDEDVNDGAIPQAPAGFLTVITLDNGAVTEAGIKKVELTGQSIAPDDAEAEFVDFNDNDEIAVTLQENNYVAIIDAKTATVIGGFEAGETGVSGVDTKNDGKIDFSADKDAVPREPDAVKWLDNERLAIANEGDWNGGSRGWTIFSREGEVLFDSGNALDVNAAQLGHYPDYRNKKGVEPEGMEVATFGDTQYIFIAEERSSLIAVYKDNGAEPEFVQTLPSGISPEGVVAIPSRNLIATANEVDLREDGGVGSHVMVYELTEADAPAYPTIMSDLDADGHPIGWSAISGAVGDAEKPATLYAVSDNALYAAPAIYTIDASAVPAKITGKTIITRNGDVAQMMDMEGITLDGEGGFWLANEGDSDRLTPHALIHVNADGEIEEEIGFPVELLAGQKRFGAEGIAKVDDVLWVAMQREWGDDEKGFVKLLAYNLETEEWGAVSYPLEAAPEGGWVGLSEITVHGDYAYIVERDNQIADKAGLKSIYRVALSEMVPAAVDGELPVVSKELVRDLIPDLKTQNSYVVDKVESFAIDSEGNGFVITDNDGVDDSSGETHFWSIGAL